MTILRDRALVLAMGNDLLADDGVGIHAARLLRTLVPPRVDIVETTEAGFALLEFLEGYEKVLILDAIQTGKAPPGTIISLAPEDFSCVDSPSPHYAGLPDLQKLARNCGIAFPSHVQILAMEVQDPYSIGAPLTPAVAFSLQDYVRTALSLLHEWVDSPCSIVDERST
jgi:hydrogenase maturation protease